MDQQAVGFLEAGLEFVEQAHNSTRNAKAGLGTRSVRGARRSPGLELLDVFVGDFHGADERFAFAQAWQSERR